MENKNTAWFFGDSFTQMLCIGKFSEYGQWKGEATIPWTTIISEFLKLNELNLSKGGKSTQEIFFDCINNFNNIKEGDWVFITDSPYVRTVGVDQKNNRISTYNVQGFLCGNEVGESNDINCGVPQNAIDKKEILIDYILNFIDPYQDIWEKYWRDNMINLINVFKCKNINVVYWSYKIWGNFLSITEETNKQIIDEHWGRTGNDAFANYLIERIKNKQWVCETEWKDEE